MPQKLNITHLEQLTSFAYAHEAEAQFILGCLGRYEDPFQKDNYYAIFDESGEIKALAVNFLNYNNFVVIAKTDDDNTNLTDFAVADGNKFKFVANLTKYSKTTIKHLLQKHNYQIKEQDLKDVFFLAKDKFQYTPGKLVERPSSKDLDEIVALHTKKDIAEVTPEDRKKVNLDDEYILKQNGKIVSRAYVQGQSKNYFQIGGVITDPEYRRRGFSRQVINELIQDRFNRGAIPAIP
jgi:predicted GNAT family acetyltransferase